MIDAIGIDYGTTNSTVCLFDGTQFRFVDLEDGSHTIPSLLYIDREFHPTYGERARQRFLEENLNRQIKLEETDLGYIQLTMGDGAFESMESSPFSPASTTIDARVSAYTDQNLPGFLFASTKRLLGQKSMSSVRLFEKNFKLEAVVSSVLQHILKRTNAQYPELGSYNASVGRPVNYECVSTDKQSACNQLAIQRMERALEFAGVGEYEFFLEPIAPVLAEIGDRPVDAEETMLVLDFGGGTLDYSLLKRSGSQIRVIGNLGMALGGDIITEQLIRDHVFPKMGLSRESLEELRRRHNYLGEMVPDILNWRTTYKLNQPKYFMRITDAARLLPEEARNLGRVRLLITQNYSYNVFNTVENAKKMLSEVEHTEINLSPIGIRFVLNRHDLETSIAGYLESVETTIRGFCDDLECQTTDVDRVILTGGTSLIPSIRERIERIFPHRVDSVDPFLSIVKGFAYGAWLNARGRITLEGEKMRIDM